MQKVIVASQNPVKIESVRLGFHSMFPALDFVFEGCTVSSGVSDQPQGSQETYTGAFNRAVNAQKNFSSADYWVGLEGGIEDQGSEMAAFAWIVVLTKDRCGKARTGTFYLPPAVATLIRAGKELGDADDIVFGQVNSKQDNGAIGILTGNVINRAELYKQAVILALVPFRNVGLYN